MPEAVAAALLAKEMGAVGTTARETIGTIFEKIGTPGELELSPKVFLDFTLKL